MMLRYKFFARDALVVAKELLGKVIRMKHHNLWLKARIVETEAYFIHDKASHASLGYTPKRRALFMPPGTIYMYYSRAGDSLNVSCLGEGNAVLIKAAYPDVIQMTAKKAQRMLLTMQSLYTLNTPALHKARCNKSSQLQPPARTIDIPNENGFSGLAPIDPSSLAVGEAQRLSTTGTYSDIREDCGQTLQQSIKPKCEGYKICSGQTLLCRSLGLKVKDWDQKKFTINSFYLDDIGYRPSRIISTKRLGITPGRDEHLFYRFIDYAYAQYCTSNPLRSKRFKEGRDYEIL